eukprot:COSAG01_NODE_55973_length_321_cov_1.333333_1_plen_76_part_01
MVLSPVELLLILCCAVAIRFFLMRGVVMPCKRLVKRCWLRIKHRCYLCLRADASADGDDNLLRRDQQADLRMTLMG